MTFRDEARFYLIDGADLPSVTTDAAEQPGMPSEQGLVVRVPKVLDDSVTEVVSVPATVALDDFLAALHLRRWHRRAAGRSPGSAPSVASALSGDMPRCSVPVEVGTT